MINQQQITELFYLWNNLSFTKLLLVNQLKEKFIIEFVIDESFQSAPNFLDKIKEIVIKKHPAGTISFISYWGFQGEMSTQYKRYRIDFIDSLINESIDLNKLNIFIENVKKIINNEKIKSEKI